MARVYSERPARIVLAPPCEDSPVLTAVISDLHLGTGSGVDLLRRPEIAALLAGELEGIDRLVLLGDVLELRDRPLRDSLDAATSGLEAISEAAGEAEIVVVPGNHDHHLIETWLERRALVNPVPLGLEQREAPEGGSAVELAARLGSDRVTFSYPGLWLRDDVYAMHGHYLDRHLTIPTLERLGVAMVERLLGIETGGADPLSPPESHDPITPDEYERAQQPVYSFLFGLAQATVGERAGGADPSVRIWKLLSGGESRVARMRSWLLGSVALPGAVGIANRLGLGPVGADLSPRAIARAGIAAMSEAVERLGVEADHVIFGHTHRRGPIDDEPGWTAGHSRLWNTGSWVHTPSLLGETAAVSPYWPGTIAFVGDKGPPRLRHSLDELSREDLAAS
jgi:predicted phosphodiesterase